MLWSIKLEWNNHKTIFILMCLCVFNVFLWISYFSIKIRGHLKPIGCECGRNFPPASTGVGVIFHPVAFWGEVGRVVNPPFDDGTGGWTFLKLNASEAVQGKEGVPIPIPIPVDFHRGCAHSHSHSRRLSRRHRGGGSQARMTNPAIPTSFVFLPFKNPWNPPSILAICQNWLIH
jgi:hypothetical protein